MEEKKPWEEYAASNVEESKEKKPWEEYSDESSPKSNAPSNTGGESGARITPSTSTLPSAGSESESWTETINPLKDSKPKYEPNNFGEILKKAKIGVINPDLDEVVNQSKPMNVGGVEVSVKGGEAPPMALNVPKKEVDQDIDLLVKRTNVVRKLREQEIDKAKQFRLGLEQLKQEGADLNEQYKANPTPELEAQLNQTVKDLQDTEKAYNRSVFAQSIYENRILQTSDSIKKLANDKVPDNFFSGFYSGMKDNLESRGKAYDLATMGKAEQIQYAKDQSLKAATKESTLIGEGGQMLGGVAPDIAEAIGWSLAGLPFIGAASVAARQGAQQATEDFSRVFNEVKSKGLPSGKKDINGKDIMREATDDEAYDIAIRAAGIGAATGAAEGLVGTLGGGKIVKAVANKARTQGGKIVAEKALDTASDAAIAGGMQVTRNAFDQYQGIDTKITQGVGETMLGEALLSVPMNTFSGVGEYSKAKKETAVREVFKAINESKSNPYELQKLQSNLDVLKSQKLISDVDYNELNKKAEDYIRVVETIPTEVSDKQKAADLIIERDELEAKKESVDKAFQKPIDEKINAINDELVVMATPVELKKNTSPTPEKYGTINRNDGKGVVNLTKEEFEAEQANMQPKAEGTTPLKDVESTAKALKEVDLADSNIPLPQLEIDGYKRKASENYKLNDAVSIAEAYHIAKADGSNPELVKAVEELLTPKPTTNEEANEDGEQKRGKDGEENVPESLQNEGEDGGQEVDVQEGQVLGTEGAAEVAPLKDENGEPLIVYRSTYSENDLNDGVNYFAEDADYSKKIAAIMNSDGKASDYVEKKEVRTIPVNISAKRVYELPNGIEMNGNVIKGLIKKDPDFTKKYDAVKGIDLYSDNKIVYAVFDKNNIKPLNKQEITNESDIQQQVDKGSSNDGAVGDIAKEDNAYKESRQITEEVSKENPSASILITPKGNDLNLTALYVGKENRGKGIGSKVLDSVKKQADKLGKKVILDATNELDEETDLERLGKFYEANGFKKVGDNKFEYNPNKGDIAKESEAVKIIDDEYIYHGTKDKNIESIVKEGLKVGTRWHTNGKIFFSPSEKISSIYGNILRIKKSAISDLKKADRSTKVDVGDVFETRIAIKPSDIEIKTESGWKPLQETPKAEQTPTALRDVESTTKALEGNQNAINVISGDEYYHGTSLPKSEADFTTANKDKGVGVRSNAFMGTSREQKSPFFFITSERDVANDFAQAKADYNNEKLNPKEKHNSRIIPFKFDEKNSKILDLTKDDYEQKLNELGFDPINDYGIGMYDESMMWEYLDNPKFYEKLKSEGYDAVKYVEPKRGVGVAVLNADKIVNSTPKGISEAYHKAKSDGSNPELVKAVESLLSKEQTPQPKNETKNTAITADAGQLQPTNVDSEVAKDDTKGEVKLNSKIDYVINKLKGKVDAILGNAKGRLSEKESFIFKKEITNLEDKAVKEGKVSFNEDELINFNYEKINGKEQKINIYEVDGYKIEHKYASGSQSQAYTEITTPTGERIVIYNKKYKNEQGNDVYYFEAEKQENKQPKTKKDGTNIESEVRVSESDSEVETKSPSQIRTEKRKSRSEAVNRALSVVSSDPFINALQYFIRGGKVNTEDLKKFFSKTGKQSGQEKKYDSTEFNSRIGLRSDSGLTINDIAHKLWEQSDVESGLESMNFRNAVETVLLDYNGTALMVDKINQSNDMTTDTDKQKSAEEKFYAMDEVPSEVLDEVYGMTESEAEAMYAIMNTPEFDKIQEEAYLKQQALENTENVETLENRVKDLENLISKKQKQANKLRDESQGDMFSGVRIQMFDPSEELKGLTQQIREHNSEISNLKDRIVELKEKVIQPENQLDIEEEAKKAAAKEKLTDPKNASDVAKIYRNKFGFTPQRSVWAARMFEAKAAFMSKILGISKEDYYKQYWFGVNEGDSGLSQSERNKNALSSVEETAKELKGANIENVSGGIKAFRGQQKGMTGRWFTPSKKFAEIFANSVKGKAKLDAEVIEQTVLGNVLDFPYNVTEYAKISDKLADMFGVTQQEIRDALSKTSESLGKGELIRIHALLEDKNFGDLLASKGIDYIKSKENLTRTELVDTFLKISNKPQEQLIAEAYHKAKIDGSNPALVESVESLIAEKIAKQEGGGLNQIIEQSKENNISLGGKGKGFLNAEQIKSLTKEIESNYANNADELLSREKDDIRTKMFNYDTPVASKTINGVDLRIAQGLTRNNKATYLLYADGGIIGEFDSVADAKAAVKFVEDRLIKNKQLFQESEKNSGFQTRDGKAIGFTYDTDKVARERFDFSKLKKIGSGSDRDVYDLGDGKVLKVAKTARGLTQNIYEGDFYLGIVPKVFERGLNYVVAENTPRIKASDVVQTFDVDGNEIGTSTAGQMLKELQQFSQKDFDNKVSKLQDVLAKYGLQDVASYEVLWNDFTAQRNWGYKDGVAYHSDGGTFGGVNMISSYKGKTNMSDPEFREIYQESKKLKKQFGDTDKAKMYQERKGSWTKDAARMKRIINMYENADSTTAVHEMLGHDYLDRIIEASATNKESEADLRTIAEEYIKDTKSKEKVEDVIKTLKDFDVENNKTDKGTKVHEWFATQAEQYFATEKDVKRETPQQSKMAKIFEAFRQHLAELYDIMNKTLIAPSEPMKKVFRKVFGEENFNEAEKIREENVEAINNLNSAALESNKKAGGLKSLADKLKEKGLGQSEFAQDIWDAASELIANKEAKRYNVTDALKKMFPAIENDIEGMRKVLQTIGTKGELRQGAENILANPTILDEVKEKVAKMSEYTPETLKQVGLSTNEVIDYYIGEYGEMAGLEKIKSLLDKGEFDGYTEKVAIQQSLIGMYNRLAKFGATEQIRKEALNNAVDVAEQYINQGTSFGRAINAYKLLGSLTTEGRLVWAKRQTNKYVKPAHEALKESIRDLKAELKDAYKQVDYFFEQTLGREETEGQYKEAIAQYQAEIDALKARKPREPKASKPAYKGVKVNREFKESDLANFAKDILSGGLFQDMETMTAPQKLAYGIMEKKPTNISEFAKAFGRYLGKKIDPKELESLYVQTRDLLITKDLAFADGLSTNEQLRADLEGLEVANKAKIEELERKKAEAEAKIADKAKKGEKKEHSEELADFVIKDAKKAMNGSIAKQKTYLDEILKALKEKTADVTKKGEKGKVQTAKQSEVEAIKFALDAINNGGVDANMWNDAVTQVKAKIKADNDLSQAEKDNLTEYLDGYTNFIYDNLLSENKIFKVIREKLIQSGYGNGKLVNWKQIIEGANGDVDVMRESIQKLIKNQLQDYDNAQVENVLDAIVRKYDQEIDKQRKKIADKYIEKELSDKKSTKKKTAAVQGKIGKILVENRLGILKDGNEDILNELAAAKGLKSMSAKDWKKAAELAENIENSADGILKNRAIEEMTAFIASKQPLSFMNTASSLRFAGLLGRATTVAVNLISGAIEGGLLAGGRAIRGNTSFIKESFKGVSKGGFKDILFGGGINQASKTSVEVNSSGMPYFRALEYYEGKGKKIIKSGKYVGRVLDATDSVFQEMFGSGYDRVYLEKQIKLENPKATKVEIDKMVNNALSVKYNRVDLEKQFKLENPNATKAEIDQMVNDALSKTKYDAFYAQALQDVIKSGQKPTPANVKRRTYEILRESQVSQMAINLSDLESREKTFKSEFKENRGVATLFGSMLASSSNVSRKVVEPVAEYMFKLSGYNPKQAAELAKKIGDVIPNKIMPFTRGVSNVIEKALEKDIVYGLTKSLVVKLGVNKMPTTTMEEKMAKVRAEEKVKDLATTAIFTNILIYGVGSLLYAASKAWDDDEEKEGRNPEKTGVYPIQSQKTSIGSTSSAKERATPENTLVLFGQKIPLKWLGSIGAELSLTANINKALTKDSKSSGAKKVANAALDISESYMQQSFMMSQNDKQSVVALLRDENVNWDKVEDYMINDMISYGGSYVLWSGFVNQSLQGARYLSGDKSYQEAKTISEKVQKQVGLAGITYDNKKLNYMGRPLEATEVNREGIQGLLGMFSKSYKSPIESWVENVGYKESLVSRGSKQLARIESESFVSPTNEQYDDFTDNTRKLIGKGIEFAYSKRNEVVVPLDSDGGLEVNKKTGKAYTKDEYTNKLLNDMSNAIEGYKRTELVNRLDVNKYDRDEYLSKLEDYYYKLEDAMYQFYREGSIDTDADKERFSDKVNSILPPPPEE